ncbi:MAG: protein kinase, partial [Planctomycetes bacterium]|nr:protein kinase [Planctomycetota bacterium]
MGIVYNGHDMALNRKVAIKVLSPNILQNETQLKRFEIEAQACGQLEHQNVVNIYRFGTIFNHPYIVMQFVDGKSLNEIIKEDGYLPVEQVIDYLMQTARGLKEAHHWNIIHRDIKPDNLLVDTRGTVKIVDFGLAKQTTSDAQLSQSGYFLGTPAYISPEQASGDPADHRADVYSLGISAFQMLTSKLPFNGTAAQVVTAHLIQELPDISDVNEECPQTLEAVIRKMASKSPDERYQSMDEVIDALEFVQKEVYGEIIVDYPKKRKPILLTVLLSIIVLLVGAGVGLYFMGILDPIIAEFTGKPITPENGTIPLTNEDGNNTTNGYKTNGNGNNGVIQKTPEEITAEKKQKEFITQALKIIESITRGFWTDDNGNEHRIDKKKFEILENQFQDLLNRIDDETERLRLNNNFYAQKTKYSEKWDVIAKDIAQEKLAEFIKNLQEIRSDTTTTLEDINENLQKIDDFVKDLPDSASKLDTFKIDLEKIKTNIEKLQTLSTKSKDESDLQIILNYLVVLGKIVKVDGKDYKFEDRDDVKGYKYTLTLSFENQMMKRQNQIPDINEESELASIQKLVDDYAALKILDPKEKEKYKFVTQSIENRRKKIEHNESLKEVKEELIQEIDECLSKQDLETMQSLRRKINRQENEFPEIFDDEIFCEWLDKLDNTIERRKVEEEEFTTVRAG